MLWPHVVTYNLHHVSHFKSVTCTCVFCSGWLALIEGTWHSKPVMNCKFSFILVLKTALVGTADLILEDRVMYLAFCWKGVVIIIGLGTNFYCRFVVCTRVAGDKQELWESATFHRNPHEYCVYLNTDDNFFSPITSSEKWELKLKSCAVLGVLFISMFMNI